MLRHHPIIHQTVINVVEVLYDPTIHQAVINIVEVSSYHTSSCNQQGQMTNAYIHKYKREPERDPLLFLELRLNRRQILEGLWNVKRWDHVRHQRLRFKGNRSDSAVDAVRGQGGRAGGRQERDRETAVACKASLEESDRDTDRDVEAGAEPVALL